MGGRNAVVLTVFIMLIEYPNTVTYVTKIQVKRRGAYCTPFKGEYFVAREEGCLTTLYILHVAYQLLQSVRNTKKYRKLGGSWVLKISN